MNVNQYQSQPRGRNVFLLLDLRIDIPRTILCLFRVNRRSSRPVLSSHCLLKPAQGNADPGTTEQTPSRHLSMIINVSCLHGVGDLPFSHIADETVVLS
jgi:hypothetical protein